MDWTRAPRTLVTRGPSLLRGLVRTRTLGPRISPTARLTGPGTYRLHPGSRIGDGARLWVGPGATLEMHPGARIGDRTIVNVATRVVLGPGTEVSWDAQIMDTDFHEIRREDAPSAPVTAPTVLGRNVLVGTRALVLKGVTIGDDSVVAAGAVVTRDVPAGSVVAGNPARVVSRTVGWQ